MAGPSVTHSFTAGTTVLAGQVNTNFNDLVVGATNGTKDYNINALTANGLATLKAGASIEGDITADINNTRTIGASATRLANLYSTLLNVSGTATIGTAAIAAGTATLSSATITSLVLGGQTITSISPACDSVLNLGINYSAGTFSVVSDNLSSLSSSNPAYIRIPRTTGTGTNVFTITSGVSFIDDVGASDIVGEEFGTTAGAAWGNGRPFFIYAVNTDDTNAGVRFAISPDPRKLNTPSSSLLLGKKGSPATTADDNSLWFIDSGTVSGFTSKPCILIGGFRMTKSSADDWTVAALTLDSGDGIRPDPFRGSIFTLPTLQMGADSGYCINNGGTAPVFSNNTVVYEIDTYGYCTARYDLDGDGGTDGSGAVNMRVALPYKWNAGSTPDSNSGITPIRIGTPTGGNIRFFEGATSDQSYFTVIDSSTNNILWSAFTNGSRHIWGHIRFKVAF